MKKPAAPPERRIFLDTREEFRYYNELYNQQDAKVKRALTRLLRKHKIKCNDHLQEFDGYWISPNFSWFGQTSYRDRPLTVENLPLVQIMIRRGYRANSFIVRMKKDGSIDLASVLEEIQQQIASQKQTEIRQTEQAESKARIERKLKGMRIKIPEYGQFKIGDVTGEIGSDGRVSFSLSVGPFETNKLGFVIDMLRTLSRRKFEP